MLVIIAKQKHAISIRVGHCDYTPGASKSVTTPQLLVTHTVKNAAPFFGTRKSINDQDSTPFGTPSFHKNTQNV
jgi:hypothetical protein